MSPDAGAEAIARRCHAVVVNHHERASCARLIAAATAAGALTAITAGASPTVVLRPHGQDELVLDVPPLERPVEDIGAGDVFAAAFFVALGDGRPAGRGGRLRERRRRRAHAGRRRRARSAGARRSSGGCMPAPAASADGLSRAGRQLRRASAAQGV